MAPAHADNTTRKNVSKEEPSPGNFNWAMDPAVKPSNSNPPSPEYIFASTQIQICRHQVSYRCSFQFKPEMLQYYYSPGPDAYHNGKLILLGSPEFDGGWGTRWQLSLTLDRWIDTQRWMSVYVTRLDDRINPQLLLQCEFSVINTGGNVLHAERSQLTSSEAGETRGFTKFLPFQNVVKMVIDGKRLCLEVNLTLMTSGHDNGVEYSTFQQKFLKVKRYNGKSQASTIDEMEISNDANDIEDLSYAEYTGEIQEDDRVVVNFCGQFLTNVSRTKLKEKSSMYAICLKHHPESEDVVNFPQMFTGDHEYRERKIICEYVHFIQENQCKILETGSYEDAHLLLHFANKMGTEDLKSRCLTALTMKLTNETAAMHVAVMEQFFKWIDEEDLGSFQKFFKENFEQIKETDSFKQMVPKYASQFVRLVFMPNT